MAPIISDNLGKKKYATYRGMYMKRDWGVSTCKNLQMILGDSLHLLLYTSMKNINTVC